MSTTNPITEAFRETHALQKSYSYENTPTMERRGLLIRRIIPAAMEASSGDLASVLGSHGSDDARFEGRDATGRKTLVPWVRWYSPSRSPSAQNGWYLVYLFHDDGEGVSLCLSHGSTQTKDGSYVARTENEASKLMGWAASVLRGYDFDQSVREGVKPGRGALAKAYERTTFASKFYPANAIPDDVTLLADLRTFAGRLAKLYDAQDNGGVATARDDMVADVEDQIQNIANPNRNKGQGRGLSAEQRRAIELRAMELAAEWLSRNRYVHEDVSSRQSCDFVAKRDDLDWVVEVKGTTGGPASIIVTRNEVALHKESYPNNILIIVYDIALDRTASTASGGILAAITPWAIEDDRLSPLCYEYEVALPIE